MLKCGGTGREKATPEGAGQDPGWRLPCGADGDDGDGAGSRFWAVWHGPKGEAPFSAPQAKKILGPKCRFTEFWVVFEWDGPWVAKSNIVGN